VTRPAPIAFLDVAYAAEAAGMACVLAHAWTAATPAAEISDCVACTPATYVPGEFYKRELPLLQSVIERLSVRPAVIVVDGYVWLGGNDAPGLGARLYEGFKSTIPVVGIAKTPYRDDTWSERIYRGKSRRPLYVTSAGIEKAEAAGLVSTMHGDHRIPTLLQRVDRLARAALGAQSSGG
jgi:deoxyribonuclease V